ncbi:hypothetical protein TMatcc_003807 [Talaromyces marneffei ATCC 18224]
MAQLVELGTQSFTASRLGGQCLVSRATATLIRGDDSNATELIDDKLDFRNAWITLKQELIVDLYIEAYSDPVMPVPDFIKQAVETVKSSLIKQINDIALHVSAVLRKVPDLSPPILSRRLPRRVKECVAEPHAPLGADRATLSHITIYMKTLGNTQYPTPGVKCIQHSNCLSKHETRKSGIKYTDLNEMVDCSLQYLVNGYSQQYKGLVNKPTTKEGPSLSDVAPASFKPGHYENVHQRAGLIPVVSRSMAGIFRTCQSPSAKEKLSFVKTKLRTQYGNSTDTESTDMGHLPRSLIKCVVWTALQRGTYKVVWQKSSIHEDSDTILPSDDGLLTEDSDLHDDCDRQMLNSSISSEIGSDDMLSHCDDDIEPDSGYSSFSSLEKLFPGFVGLDGLYGEVHDTINGESAIDDGKSDLIARPDTEEKDIIRSSSPPPAAAAMVGYEDVTTCLLLSSEEFDQDDLDVCREQYDEDMMDDSSCMSFITSSTYQYISEDLKRETEAESEHDETESINDYLMHTSSANVPV